MADINQSLSLVLQHEGGYVDNKNDAGGPTKYGVTQADVPGIPIQSLTVEQAIEYYKKNYVEPLYVQIKSQEICDKLTDLGILFGVGTAISLLEAVLKVEIDGIFGPHDLQAVNDADSTSLLAAYKTIFVSKALAIGAANPKDQEFVAGWINRINS